MKNLEELYEYAKNKLKINDDRILGIFLIGSQIYGLDDDDSDIDAALILLPTLDMLIKNGNFHAYSEEIIIPETGQHIKSMSIFKFREQLLNGGINSIEILYTPLYYSKNYNDFLQKIFAEKVKMSTVDLIHVAFRYIYRAKKNIEEYKTKHPDETKLLYCAVRDAKIAEDLHQGKSLQEALTFQDSFKKYLLKIKHKSIVWMPDPNHILQIIKDIDQGLLKDKDKFCYNKDNSMYVEMTINNFIKQFLIKEAL